MIERILEKRELAERIQWLIKLRWFAVGGVLVLTWFTSTVLDILPRPLPLYFIGIFIGLYNALFLAYGGKMASRKNAAEIGGRFANIQISTDLFTLSVLLHFAGGVESPFLLYFVFHVIISSILLSVKATYLQATLAVFLFSALAVLEYAHILPHVPLRGFAAPDFYERGPYVLGLLFALPTTLYLSAYMATSITKKLRQREYELVAAEESLKARTQALEEANQGLREMDKLKSEYVLKVTHELRSPLSTIESCLRAVTDGYASPGKREEMLGRAVQRTDALLMLVNDLLHLSRIKAMEIPQPMAPLSLTEVIRRTVDFMRTRAEDKKIVLKIDVPSDLPMVVGDRGNMDQLFTNLISNAIKYTTVGGTVSIKGAAEGDYVQIRVCDTGIGISESDLPRIFDEFYRGENARAYNKEGTGLGLCIVKQIVERYHGKIWVESRMGKGTTFRFALPVSPNLQKPR